MKLTNEIEINDFLTTIQSAQGNVYLKSTQGDCYNLKSPLSMYVGIAELIKHYGDDLELFCDKKEDEYLFLKYFKNHLDTLE